MTTVAQIINLALKDAGVIGEGETASAETMLDALTTLNQMLGLWQTDGLYVYAQQEVNFSADGAATYLIGGGATVDTPRPEGVQAAFWRSGETDTPIAVLNSFEEFQDICNKTQSGEPVALFYRATAPNGTIHIWPQPSSGIIHLTLLVDMPEYASQTENLSLPRSYELAVRSNLAMLLSATFGTPLKQGVAAIAGTSKKMIKRGNVRIPKLQMPAGIPVHGGYDINRGE